LRPAWPPASTGIFFSPFFFFFSRAMPPQENQAEVLAFYRKKKNGLASIFSLVSAQPAHGIWGFRTDDEIIIGGEKRKGGGQGAEKEKKKKQKKRGKKKKKKKKEKRKKECETIGPVFPAGRVLFLLERTTQWCAKAASMVGPFGNRGPYESLRGQAGRKPIAALSGRKFIFFFSSSSISLRRSFCLFYT